MPKKKQSIYILASDPGKVNHGISILKAHLEKGVLKIEVVAVKKLKRMVTSFKEPLYTQIAEYRKEVAEFLKKHSGLDKPDVLIIERFMGRGLRGGLAELVTIMITTQLLTYAKDCPSHVIGASLWKNAANRHFNLKKLYLNLDKNCSVHELDAVLMGYWAAAKYYDQEPFAALKTKLKVRKMVSQLKVGADAAA